MRYFCRYIGIPNARVTLFSPRTVMLSNPSVKALFLSGEHCLARDEKYMVLVDLNTFHTDTCYGNI